MKKVSLTIGLFTLVLASTSFASSKTTTTSIAINPETTSIDIDGGQSSGGNRKVDYNGSTFNTKTNLIVDIDGGQSSGGNRKVD
ncbi:hypothetical protein [Flavobacterium adhaerens]|uniref:hypothetical protein n=1 Tax=Flavobacterium adhaerens TaxID=3149043 RepID=UPI0032B51D3E